jgi:uncharacterized protein with GYD domain
VQRKLPHQIDLDVVRRILMRQMDLSERSRLSRSEGLKPGGASLDWYYWMFGQYDGAAVFDLPDSHTMAAVSLAITSSGALSRFETHELIDSRDLTAIAERAKGITYQPPGA